MYDCATLTFNTSSKGRNMKTCLQTKLTTHNRWPCIVDIPFMNYTLRIYSYLGTRGAHCTDQWQCSHVATELLNRMYGSVDVAPWLASMIIIISSSVQHRALSVHRVPGSAPVPQYPMSIVTSEQPCPSPYYPPPRTQCNISSSLRNSIAVTPLKHDLQPVS